MTGMADVSQRKVALIAGLGLLLMAVLAPFAHFGVSAIGGGVTNPEAAPRAAAT
jgi:hypothetical protein